MRKAEAERARPEADAARAQAEAERQRAEAARRGGRGRAAAGESRERSEASRARDVASAAEREKAELRDRLRQQLSVILETRETARGLIVNLSDVLFDTAQATLKPGAREKLARVSGILVTHPDLKLEIEGHTDSVGSDDYNQRLSERRAESVRSLSRVSSASRRSRSRMVGFGESRRWPPTTRPRGGSAIGASSSSCRVKPSARTRTEDNDHASSHTALRRSISGQHSIRSCGSPCRRWRRRRTAPPTRARWSSAIYRQVLERSPNGGEATTWVNQLTSGQATVRELVENIAASAEHRQRFLPGESEGSRRQAVTNLYRAPARS